MEKVDSSTQTICTNTSNPVAAAPSAIVSLTCTNFVRPNRGIDPERILGAGNPIFENRFAGLYPIVVASDLPHDGLKGATGNPITISALNDGKVEIDGQGDRRPVITCIGTGAVGLLSGQTKSPPLFILEAGHVDTVQNRM